VDLYEIDRLQYLMAEAQGKTLPDVEVGPELATLIERVEAQCGYRVMARPHSFGVANGAGSTNHEQQVITLLVHPEVPQEASRRYLYHECAHTHVERDFPLQWRRLSIALTLSFHCSGAVFPLQWV